MTPFQTFAKMVAKDFQAIAAGERAFTVSIDGDALYAAYLAAFPPGTDPIFKKRTEHDCSCCKQFIRRAGNVVAVASDGTLRTVWDSAAEKLPNFYGVVAAALRDQVRAAGIDGLFRVPEKETRFGAEASHSLDKEIVNDAEVVRPRTWSHFFTGEIPAKLRPKSPGTEMSDWRSGADVFARGLTELTDEALGTISDLIVQNALYKGEEFGKMVAAFRALSAKFRTLDGASRRTFVWDNAGHFAARFRNTAIGTLAVALSEGEDAEAAVKAFESKVAPANYKRPTAVITPAMVAKAMESIAEMGLEPAIERRHARLSDVSPNDVLWTDRNVVPLMRGGLADALMRHAEASAPRSAKSDEDRAEDVSIDDFLAKILPTATGIEILVKGEHIGNFVSLTAPVNPDAPRLFKWDGNPYAWSYTGGVADSLIAERVKKAGGTVEGATLRVSLSWYNYDDLDLHVHEPPGRGVHVLNEIFFRNKRGWTGGTLDVDMNAGGGTTREPVENIVWTQAVPKGAYRIVVNNFRQREMRDVGFVVEVECAGKVSHFSYNKAVRDQADIHVATLHMNGGVIERIEPGDPGVIAQNVSQDKWGIATEKYAKVSLVTLSPNHWAGSAAGNRHFIFILDGCKSGEPTRGFYNEQLRSDLERHRKVFEVIGAKTLCPPSDDQLSGLGFSSTKAAAFICRVQQGKKQRILHVQVGGAA